MISNPLAMYPVWFTRTELDDDSVEVSDQNPIILPRN